MVKNPPANAGIAGLILGLGRYPGIGNSNPLQYSCLENSMDREVCWDTVCGVTVLYVTEKAEHTRQNIFRNSFTRS